MASDRLGALAPAATRVPLLVAGGVLGALAFPVTGWWPLAWIWLLPALLSALVLPPRAAFRDGWLEGTVFFVLLLRWLDHTFRHYSAIPWPLTWLPILLLAGYCALYLGLAGAWVAGSGAPRARPRAGDVAPLWVAGEWLRGWLMDGFPWGLAGYSQHGVLPIIQIAELTGVYGVSFLLVAVNARSPRSSPSAGGARCPGSSPPARACSPPSPSAGAPSRRRGRRAGRCGSR